MLAAVLSAKHAPGGTTLALGLAFAAAASTETVLLEADPAGGDLASRLSIGFDPGTVSLAAGARHGVSPELVRAHANGLSEKLAAILAPPSEPQARRAVGTVAGYVKELRAMPWLTVVDCGRYSPGSPSAPFVQGASVVVWSLWPTLECIEQVRWLLDDDLRPKTVLAVHGDVPWHHSEVAERLEMPVWSVPHKPTDVQALYEGVARFDRTKFMRTCNEGFDQMARMASETHAERVAG